MAFGGFLGKQIDDAVQDNRSAGFSFQAVLQIKYYSGDAAANCSTTQYGYIEWGRIGFHASTVAY